MNVLHLRLPGRSVAVPATHVVQVVLRPHLVVLPEKPDWLTGFLRWNSTLVPIVDLSALWREGEVPEGLYTPIVLVQVEGQLMGLLACAVESVLAVDPTRLMPLARAESLQGWAAGAFEEDGEIVALLVPPLVFTKRELERVAHWKKLAGVREERAGSDR